MKTKGFMAGLLIFLAAAVNAQLPQNVKDAFKSKYPEATIGGYNHKEGNYVIRFKSEGEKHNVTFSENGNWVQTKTKMSREEVPAPVRMALHDKYNGWHISKSYQIETPVSTQYDIDVYYEGSDRKGPVDITEHNVYISPSGNVVKDIKRD